MFNLRGVNASFSPIDKFPKSTIFGARNIYVQRKGDYGHLPPCHGGWEIFQRQHQSGQKEGVQRDRAQVAANSPGVHV
jgi:hypothetical protein